MKCPICSKPPQTNVFVKLTSCICTRKELKVEISRLTKEIEEVHVPITDRQDIEIKRLKHILDRHKQIIHDMIEGSK